MVRRILGFIGREIGGIHEAAYLLGFFAFLSQILALVRDRMLAHVFGAGPELDVYYAAFRIPDLIFVTIASMVSLSVLIPFLMEKMERGEGEAKRFLSNVFSSFSLIIVAASAIAYFLVPRLLSVAFPKLVADFGGELVPMTRILLLSPLLLGISNFLASITQVHRRYFIYALSPVLYNIGIIIGIFVLYPAMGLPGLALGVVIGAVLHLGVQLPFIISSGFMPRWTLRIQGGEVWKVLSVSLPRTLTLSSNELARFFLVSFASVIGFGAISVFNLSYNLQAVPLSIIGVSYSVAAFPVLAKHFAKGDAKSFVEQMASTARHIIFLSMPLAVLFIVLRAQIVRVILGSGRFDWTDTRLTAAAVAMFVISLIAQSMVMLFVRAYYSRGETGKPFLMNLFSAAVIIASSFFLVRAYGSFPFFRYFVQSMLRVEDVPGAAVLMLPFGFTIGSVINAVLHWIAFHRDFSGFTRPVMKTLGQSFAGAVVMGYVAYGCLDVFSRVFDLDTLLGIFMQGFLSGVIGILAGVVVLSVMKSEELRDVIKTVRGRIWKAKVVSAPDVEM